MGYRVKVKEKKKSCDSLLLDKLSLSNEESHVLLLMSLSLSLSFIVLRIKKGDILWYLGFCVHLIVEAEKSSNWNGHTILTLVMRTQS